MSPEVAAVSFGPSDRTGQREWTWLLYLESRNTSLKEKSITTFEEAENYINDLPRFTSKNSMEDTKAFLHRLGDPDRDMRIIHVAGTNGKGSACAAFWKRQDIVRRYLRRRTWCASGSGL